MNRLPCFESAQLEAACKVLGDTANGLSGSEIGYILQEIEVPDPTPSMTKWKRIFNALAEAQNKHAVGNHLIMLVNKAMAPAKYTSTPELFCWRQDGLNVALAFAGYAVRDDGKVIHTTRETTVQGARTRAGRLQSLLKGRATHDEVLKYCRAELLEENYFHAVLEAVKGIAERLRQMSGLGSDGAELVNQALSTKTPVVALNSLKSETEVSEQRGIANLLIGVFGAIRNPTAHTPKVIWAMPEQDAIDVLGILSYVHRKLDNANISRTN
ncbi:TIGR02391 family protein [Janthinobacterium sp. BJB446]|uniref:TIGR02391 family protein n=1 Tax=Janthinobacterium sp. BJB446 TaxID=2048009 RepID=UPI000C11D239|nr:TIGR02391 family protein [Janthinobacterium sp. BJB446]PHV23777.1 TIGR02391 family protein [Janthinobacterium sp. BJB446]